MILLTRHGQSMTNVDRDIELREAGKLIEINVRNNVLTERGVQDALQLGRDLKQTANVRTIVTSPYARAKQTAFCVASALATMPLIHYDPRLKEIQWKIAGRFHRLEDSIPGFDSKKLPLDHRPTVDRRRRSYTLESQLDVYRRAVPAFLDVVARYDRSDSDLLIVAHYFVLKAILAWIQHGAPEAMLDVDVRNTTPFRFSSKEIKSRQFESMSGSKL